MGKRKEVVAPELIVKPDQYEHQSSKRRRGTADEIALTLLFMKASPEVSKDVVLIPHRDHAASKVRDQQKEQRPVVSSVTDDEDEEGIQPRSVARRKIDLVTTQKSLPPIQMALDRPPVLVTRRFVSNGAIKGNAGFTPVSNLPLGRPLPPAPLLPWKVMNKTTTEKS